MLVSQAQLRAALTATSINMSGVDYKITFAGRFYDTSANPSITIASAKPIESLAYPAFVIALQFIASFKPIR